MKQYALMMAVNSLRGIDRRRRNDGRTPGHPVYAWTVLEEARRARGMPRSFLLVRHVCHKGAVPGCIITVCARHTARFIREQRKDSLGFVRGCGRT